MTPSAEDLFTATAKLGMRADLELLLDVVRLPKDDDARVAWRAFVGVNNLDFADVHVLKLVPRVIERLLAVDPEHREVARLLGIKRYLSVRSGLITYALARVERRFGKRAIRAVAIKGEAMRRICPTGRSRPMMDADLVLGSSFSGAIGVLVEDGYQVKASEPNAVTLVKGNVELDVHQVALTVDPRFDAFEWMKLGLDTALVPIDATGAFIVMCLHGMRVNGGGSWVLDAEELIRTGAVNLNVVTYYAKTRALVLTFAAALARIEGVPDAVLAEILAAPVSHIEALELRHLTSAFYGYGKTAHKLLVELRSRGDVVAMDELRKYEERPGYRWDGRWTKEWSTWEK